MKSKTIFNLNTHTNGSHTLVDSENGQAMHSRIGPESEARLVYADLAKIETRLNAPDAGVILYDVGMGTAANVLATLERLAGTPDASGTFQIFSFELKPEGLAAALSQIEKFPLLLRWEKNLTELLEKKEIQFSVGQVHVDWKLKVGDFYTLLTETPPADFIYFDFYSPKVVPELWTREKFTLIRNHLGERRCALFTYSAATPTRLHLLLAGFFVGEGVSTGMKNETTTAHTEYSELKRPLSPKWLSKLETSTSIRNSAEKEEVRTHPQWNSANTSDFSA